MVWTNYLIVWQDTKAIENKVRDENNRTKALRMLLLDPSSVSWPSPPGQGEAGTSSCTKQS
jgi:hypothetical protein